MSDQGKEADHESAFEKEEPTSVTFGDPLSIRLYRQMRVLARATWDVISASAEHGFIHQDCEACWEAEVRHYW